MIETLLHASEGYLWLVSTCSKSRFVKVINTLHPGKNYTLLHALCVILLIKLISDKFILLNIQLVTLSICGKSICRNHKRITSSYIQEKELLDSCFILIIQYITYDSYMQAMYCCPIFLQQFGLKIHYQSLLIYLNPNYFKWQIIWGKK